MRNAAALAILLALTFLIACGSGAPAASPTPHFSVQPGAGTSATNDCPFEVPPGETVNCGTLTVPADRNDASSGTVTLPIGVFKSHSTTPKPDPIIYLDGGPGGRTLETIKYSFESLVKPYLDERDFIVFDQRGVGFAKPALDCEEDKDASEDSYTKDLSDEELTARLVDAFKKCRDGLVAQNIDPAFATSAESAADLEDLRLALGYDSWNLYGISYGTRLSLTTMRDFPAGLRSVILDSTYPPEVDLTSEGPADFQRALDQLFDDCENDDRCSIEYPNLRNELTQLAGSLDALPQKLDLGQIFLGVPLNDPKLVLRLDGDVLLSAVFSALYSTNYLGSIPQMIFQTFHRDYTIVGQTLALQLFEDQHFSVGMYYSVECGEEVPFSNRQLVDAEEKKYSDIQGARRGSGSDLFTICGAWDVPAAPPIENQPVLSDVPTLVLSGNYDPITPPAWGRAVADRLTHGHFFEFPGTGHGVSVSTDCGKKLVQKFLSDPSADPTENCVDHLGPPVFVVTP